MISHELFFSIKNDLFECYFGIMRFYLRLNLKFINSKNIETGNSPKTSFFCHATNFYSKRNKKRIDDIGLT